MQPDRLEVILDLSRQMAETRNLNRLLSYAVSVAMDMFNAERGFLILLAEDGSLEYPVKRDWEGHDVDQPDEQISHTILQQVIEQGENLILADAMNTPSFGSATSVRILQVRSVLCVPMITRNGTIGALYLENRSASNVFKKADAEPLRLFASQAAIAIENAILNEKLEARIEARTHELVEANFKLEEANQQLEMFAHMVAHDLQNPLTVIVGYAALLTDVKHPLEADEMLQASQNIERMALKMQEIIESLLVLATDNSDVQVEPLDMGSIVTSALEEMSSLIKQNNAEISLPDEWPTVIGYAPWIDAVWRNYISNAIKYGGAPPRIELGYTTPSEHKCQFWVIDNGAGISEENMQLIFRPFVRLSGRTAKGHGLGLAIVQRVVQNLGGEVGVERHPEGGSLFSFTLPIATSL